MPKEKNGGISNYRVLSFVASSKGSQLGAAWSTQDSDENFGLLLTLTMVSLCPEMHDGVVCAPGASQRFSMRKTQFLKAWYQHGLSMCSRNLRNGLIN